MTLGEFIDALSEMKKDAPIRFDFSYSSPGSLSSYRGFYDHLAITGFDKNQTVGDMLTNARAAKGRVFEGYKGGEYRMGSNTPLWFAADRSSCHDTAIKSVTFEGYEAIIHTEYQSY